MIIIKNSQSDSNNIDVIEKIEYLELNLETKKEFDNLYKTLCKDKDFQDFKNTGIYGKIGHIRFVIYRDLTENNKVCIAFIEKNRKYIICMDSNEKAYQTKSINRVDIKKYIDGCCYYSITENEKLRHKETIGLNSLSKKNYKSSWMYHNKKYQIQLLEEKDYYKYEIKVIQNSGDIVLTCIWDKYEDFDNEEKPKKITLKTYQNEIIAVTHEEMELLLSNKYGISLKIDCIREYLRTGEYIDSLIPRILYEYFEIEKYNEQRSQIMQYINPKEVPKVHYNEDAIQETRHLSKRISITKRDNRP